MPYKGGSQLAMDVVGGQLDFALADVSGAAAMVKGGKTRALAISGEQRHKDFPDVTKRFAKVASRTIPSSPGRRFSFARKRRTAS